jgi:GNAT superfamily N-acetyltransferase
MTEVRIRGWQPDDRAAITDLVTESYVDDPELGAMVGGVHRPDAEPPDWRRTLLACEDDAVIGVASAAASRYHPGTSPMNVVVRPDRRRRGVGRALLAALREAVAGLGTGPLWTTVDGRSAAAVGFASAGGFAATIRYEVWQLGPGPVPPVTPPAPLTALSTVDDSVVLDAWDELYAWGHARDAAFAAPTPRDVVATETLPRLRRADSHAAYDGDRLLGLCVLADFDGYATMMLGTRPGLPGDVELATALIAATLPGPDTAVRLELADADTAVTTALGSFSARREYARAVMREPR